ncbi:MAG: SpoVR family protein [Chloroflexi bacterium]|nr:SpoVR family protein [Chloroflexota bacterium]
MDQHEIGQLERSIREIWDIVRRLGLDPFPVHFELVPASMMYEFGAYGLPGRFSHWTHGRAYHQIKTMYDYGLSKIYELVVNANPAYAFLLESNSLLQNRVVAAHVLAHVDFFHHNAYFQSTNRQMVESVTVNADRIRRYEFVHGRDEVERFLDAVLAIEAHVDPHPRLRRSSPAGEERRPRPAVTPYDDLFDLGAERQPESKPTARRLPPEPEPDLLLFIAEQARHLEDWQRDVIHIVRTEQLYFLPQMQTRVMNEGWATYWHARIIRELDLPAEEHLEFSRMHAGVLTPSRRQINPYYVGMKMFEDIERRWDQAGPDRRRPLDCRPGQGRARILDVREWENDISFFRNYLTQELVEELDLYLYRLEGNRWVIVENDWEKVREALVASLVNGGHPVIVVEDGDHRGHGELYLRHSYEGQELDIPYADRTLHCIHSLWGQTVHLETVVEGKTVVLHCDGQSVQK